MFECFNCGKRTVIWDADFDPSECGYEQNGIIHSLHCTNCGAEIQYFVKEENENNV